MYSVDIFVQNYLSSSRTPTFIEFYYLLTGLFDFSFAFILVSVLLAVLIYLVRGVYYAALFLSTVIFGGVLVYFLKYYFAVPRPLEGLVSAFGPSFPSYHATMATIFFVMLMYVFDKYLKGLGKLAFNTFCVLSVILVALSRLYLGVHWFSDVIFGVFLGVIVSYFSIILFRNIPK